MFTLLIAFFIGMYAQQKNTELNSVEDDMESVLVEEVVQNAHSSQGSFIKHQFRQDNRWLRYKARLDKRELKLNLHNLDETISYRSLTSKYY